MSLSSPDIWHQIRTKNIHDELQKAAARMGVSINDLVEEAVTTRLDDRTVTLTARNGYEATRQRRLAREHGSLGPPFPNDDTRMTSWNVCELTAHWSAGIRSCTPTAAVGSAPAADADSMPAVASDETRARSRRRAVLPCAAGRPPSTQLESRGGSHDARRYPRSAVRGHRCPLRDSTGWLRHRGQPWQRVKQRQFEYVAEVLKEGGKRGISGADMRVAMLIDNRIY
jgi:hypothetical protein